MIIHLSFIVSALLLLIVFLLIAVAFFTLVERKFMGSIQRRKGPKVVGILGIFFQAAQIRRYFY